MWRILFFHQCFQDTVGGQLGTVRAIHAEWHVGGMSRSLGGWFFFCKCFTFFPIDVGKVLCNFPVTLIMQLCVTTALDNIKDATCYQVVGSPSQARDTRRAPGSARGRWPSSPPWLMSCSWGSSYCSRSIFWRGKVTELAVIKHTEASAGRWWYTANKLKLLISPSK